MRYQGGSGFNGAANYSVKALGRLIHTEVIEHRQAASITVGLALFCPAMSRALPCTASRIALLSPRSSTVVFATGRIATALRQVRLRRRL